MDNEKETLIMDEKSPTTEQVEKANSVEAKKEIDIDMPPKKNPLNLILIGLIVIMIIALGFQYLKMQNIDDNYEDLLGGDNDVIVETVPVEKVTLNSNLFISEAILLDFSDITLSLENEDIRSYYDELTSDISNFTQVTDKTFMPSDNMFELRYKDTLTSIYFFDAVVDQHSYCMVVTDGTVLGYYLIPSVYYGNLFNIVQSSSLVTEHTKEILKQDFEELITHKDEVSIILDENHGATKNTANLNTFDTLIKNKEKATVMVTLPDETHLILCYTNFRYYAFQVNNNGEIIQEASYTHYSSTDNYIYFYNTSLSEVTENYLFTFEELALKVVSK